jgi:MtN3 and saliva related transmembrane protein
MTALATVALLIGVTGALRILPQVLKIFRRKSAKDISVLTYIFLMTSALVWTMYGFELDSSLMVVITNSINCR